MALPNFPGDPVCLVCGETGWKQKSIEKEGIVAIYCGAQCEYQEAGVSSPCMKIRCRCNYQWFVKTLQDSQ